MTNNNDNDNNLELSSHKRLKLVPRNEELSHLSISGDEFLKKKSHFQTFDRIGVILTQASLDQEKKLTLMFKRLIMACLQNFEVEYTPEILFLSFENIV